MSRTKHTHRRASDRKPAGFGRKAVMTLSAAALLALVPSTASA